MSNDTAIDSIREWMDYFGISIEDLGFDRKISSLDDLSFEEIADLIVEVEADRARLYLEGITVDF